MALGPEGIGGKIEGSIIKKVTIRQLPTSLHIGMSGNFPLEIKNIGNVPVSIIGTPTFIGPNIITIAIGGGPFPIQLNVGQSILLPCHWTFHVPPPCRATGFVSVDFDPGGIIFNVYTEVGFEVKDTIPPICEVTGVNPGPPMSVTGRIYDTGSGLKQINTVEVINATLNIPPFSIGTKDSIIVTGTKIDQSKLAYVLFEIFDVAGNSKYCDPLYTTISANIPEEFNLSPNFPNPFNPTTTIHFDVPATSTGKINVQLKVYDILGRQVRTLVDEEMEPGSYSVQWDGRNNQGERVSGSVYLYQMKSNGFIATRKMVLLK